MGYQAVQEGLKAFFLNNPVSMGLGYMSEQKSHSKPHIVRALILGFNKKGNMHFFHTAP